MNKEKQNIIPELRFPVFENGWEKVKLKDVSTYFNGKSFEGDVQEEGKYELITLKSIDASGNLVHSKRYINDEVPTLTKGTLVMILSEQAPGLLGMTAIIPLDNKFVLNQRVAEIRPNDKVESFFLSMAINRNQRIFSRLGAGMKVQNISKPNVENYEFYYPTLPEQKKIANCLSSLDSLITAETEKLAYLKDHKKGLLQQLFPAIGETKPQYRFPEFENDGDWIETILENCLDYLQPTPYLVSSTAYEDKFETPVLTAGKHLF
jgi:type I restriction enzyme S subunit